MASADYACCGQCGRKTAYDPNYKGRVYCGGCWDAIAQGFRESVGENERLRAALAGMLTVEVQDRGHVHTIGMTYNARDALAIPEGMPIQLWQVRQAKSKLGEKD